MSSDEVETGPSRLDDEAAPLEQSSEELEGLQEETPPSVSEQEGGLAAAPAAEADGLMAAPAAEAEGARGGTLDVTETQVSELADDVAAGPATGGAEAAAPEPDEEWAPQGHDMVPLLPRGTALFEGIPAGAIVIDALCPAIGHGAVIVRGTGAIGIVLVEGGVRVEDYSFAGGAALQGEGARSVIHSWDDATVAAYRFDPLVVAVLPSLFRGTPCYADLRLEWTDWHGLLGDLCHRDGSFVVELETPLGRGVTLIVDGRQVATYTDGHPELGPEDLLDPLAEAGRGTIWVQREPTAATAPHVIQDNAGGFGEPRSDQSWGGPPDAVTEIAGQAAPAWDVNPGWGGTPPDRVVEASGFAAPMHAPAYAGAATPSRPGAAASPFAPFSVAPPQPSPWTSPGAGGMGSLASGSLQVPTADLAPQLKQLARLRLQRSASRVEAMVDQAAAEQLPLEALLADIRGLVIRGVMQSTLDDLADDMARLVGA
jgi:hypothetical protein